MTERQVQSQVVRLYRSVGCAVYSTSQYRASRVARGLPDLYVCHRRVGGWWHETKGSNGKQQPAQAGFQQAMTEAGVPYVLGGVEEARAFLVEHCVLIPYIGGHGVPQSERGLIA